MILIRNKHADQEKSELLILLLVLGYWPIIETTGQGQLKCVWLVEKIQYWCINLYLALSLPPFINTFLEANPIFTEWICASPPLLTKKVNFWALRCCFTGIRTWRKSHILFIYLFSHSLKNDLLCESEQGSSSLYCSTCFSVRTGALFGFPPTCVSTGCAELCCKCNSLGFKLFSTGSYSPCGWHALSLHSEWLY